MSADEHLGLRFSERIEIEQADGAPPGFAHEREAIMNQDPEIAGPGRAVVAQRYLGDDLVVLDIEEAQELWHRLPTATAVGRDRTPVWPDFNPPGEWPGVDPRNNFQ